MAQAIVRVEGLDELLRNLKALPVRVERLVVANALKRAAAIVNQETHLRAPILPHIHRQHPHLGHLKGNITTTYRRLAHGGKAVVHTNKAFWGYFLEYGTKHAPAYPFFRPAWDATALQALDKLTDELHDGINRVAPTARARPRRVV